MATSNYPNGFANGVTIRGVPISVSNPGESFYVNSTTVLAKGGVGGSDGNPGTYQKPFATLDYAIGRCTASRGDVIYLMPGHAENIATAGAITADVAGVTVVGLGSGSLMPKFSFTLATADLLVSATNVSFYNVQFEANIADVTAGLDINSNNTAFYNCKFTEAGTDLNYVVVMNVADGVDDLVVEGCTVICNDGLNDNFIQAAGTHDNFVIRDNYMAFYTAQTTTTEGIIEVATDANNFIIENNRFWSTSAVVDNAFVTLAGTGNTGWAINNCLKGIDLDATGANLTGAFDVTGLGSFNNLGVVDADAAAVDWATDDDLT